MRPRLRNFGFHQLIGKRPFLPDTYIRKPWILRFFEMYIFIGALMVIGVAFGTEHNIYISAIYAVIGVLLFSSAYLTATETNHFKVVSITALSVLASFECGLWFIDQENVHVALGGLALIPIAPYRFLPNVQEYTEWVASNAKNI